MSEAAYIKVSPRVYWQFGQALCIAEGQGTVTGPQLRKCASYRAWHTFNSHSVLVFVTK